MDTTKNSIARKASRDPNIINWQNCNVTKQQQQRNNRKYEVKNANGKKKTDSNSSSNSNFGTGFPQLDEKLLAVISSSAIDDVNVSNHSQQRQYSNINKPKFKASAATMTVVVQRVNLVDGWKSPCVVAVNKEEEQQQRQHSAAFALPNNAILFHEVTIAPYSFSKPNGEEPLDNAQEDQDDDFFDSFGGNHDCKSTYSKADTVAVVYAPVESCSFEEQQLQKGIIESTINNGTAAHEDSTSSTNRINPFAEMEQYDKYWAQRKRLFSRFDEGIQLGDAQGWYSVTPEAIADHVARRMGEIASYCSAYKPIVVFDAFCGCGGNAIAFGKTFSVSLVVCCDVDLEKLRNAAHNAAVYGIPRDKIIFIHGDSLHIMRDCYVEGTLVTQQQSTETVFREEVKGYTIGNSLKDLLPPHIDAIFMDPPWGGIHYGAAGRNGYDLAKNMKIKYHNDTRTADGFDLLAMAASATKTKFVVYDIPRNTNKLSIARAALAAGYKGNMKLEEYYLNGRLKTATAFLGWDYKPQPNKSGS